MMAVEKQAAPPAYPYQLVREALVLGGGSFASVEYRAYFDKATAHFDVIAAVAMAAEDFIESDGETDCLMVLQERLDALWGLERG
jgi:hypothetical protein